MFPDLLHLDHLSNLEEIYDIHLKLIVLSHDQLTELSH